MRWWLALACTLALFAQPIARAQDDVVEPTAADLALVGEAETAALAVRSTSSRCLLWRAGVLEAAIAARASASPSDHERAIALIYAAWLQLRAHCRLAGAPPRRPLRHDDGSDGLFPPSTSVTHDLRRDVDTDARVTSVAPTELVLALDAAPHAMRVVFPAAVPLTVHTGDALHVVRRTRRVAGAARHDLLLSDAAGMLVLAISDTGDPTFLPGWEIRAATDTPGTRFDHTARWTTVLETEWRRLETRDGAWQLLATEGAIQIVRTE